VAVTVAVADSHGTATPTAYAYGDGYAYGNGWGVQGRGGVRGSVVTTTLRSFANTFVTIAFKSSAVTASARCPTSAMRAPAAARGRAAAAGGSPPGPRARPRRLQAGPQLLLGDGQLGVRGAALGEARERAIELALHLRHIVEHRRRSLDRRHARDLADVEQ